jgi:hypothetical protein
MSGEVVQPYEITAKIMSPRKRNFPVCSILTEKRGDFNYMVLIDYLGFILF